VAALEKTKFVNQKKTFMHGLDIAHFLHADCLKSHLLKKFRCPVCQVPVKTDIFEAFQAADFAAFRKYNTISKSQVSAVPRPSKEA
jgi:hypothetical protein